MKIITMKQLLQNPTGYSSSNYARRDLIISGLEMRYNQIVKKRKIIYNTYYDKGDYYFHLRIPSEVFTEELYYDVVLQFIPVGSSSGSLTINDYAMKVFSNSPNFMFTYAYVFNKDKLIVDFVKEKLNKLSLTQKPKIKNPSEDLGFEKSIYFSLLFIKENKLNNKSYLKSLTKNLDTKKILKDIDTADNKLKEYNKYKEKEAEEKRKEKERANKQKASKNLIQAKNRTKTSKTKTKTRSDITKSRKNSSFKTIKPKRIKTSTRKK